MNWWEIFSGVTGILAIVLGIVSIIVSLAAKKHASDSRKEAAEYYERTKDLLHKIDTRSAVMEEKVSENFSKMMDTQSELINKALIPQGPSAEQEMGMAVMTEMMKDPAAKKRMFKMLENTMKNAQDDA